MQSWQQYASDGVAVQTTFGRMKAAVNEFSDGMHMDVVRYGDKDITHYNLLQFMFTKRTKFKWEQEIAIAMFSPDRRAARRGITTVTMSGIERRSATSTKCTRRLLGRVVITGIAISPWASEPVANEVKQEWASIGPSKVPVEARWDSSLIPSAEEFARYGVGCVSPLPTAKAC